MSLETGDHWEYKAVNGWRNHSMFGFDSSILTVSLIGKTAVNYESVYTFEFKDSCFFRFQDSTPKLVTIDTILFPVPVDSIDFFGNPVPGFVYYEFFKPQPINLDTAIQVTDSMGNLVDKKLVATIFVNGESRHAFSLDTGPSRRIYLEDIGLYWEDKTLSVSATSRQYFTLKLIKFNNLEMVVE